jgi:hypothetical protein
LVFRSLYQDLMFLQLSRLDRDMVGALARLCRMDRGRMFYRLRPLRDRYPAVSVGIAGVSVSGLAAYFVARRSG